MLNSRQDRDGELWGLDPSVIEQRRALFWELNVFLGFLVRIS